MLAGTQGLTHIAQFVLAFKCDRDIHVALAKAHQGVADLLCGAGHIPDQRKRQDQNTDGSSHHSGNNRKESSLHAVLDSGPLLGHALFQKSIQFSGRIPHLCLKRGILIVNDLFCLLQIELIPGAAILLVKAHDLFRNRSPLAVNAVILFQQRLVLDLTGPCLIQAFGIGLHRLQSRFRLRDQAFVGTAFGDQKRITVVPARRNGIDPRIQDGHIGLHIFIHKHLILAPLIVHHHEGGNNERYRNHNSDPISQDQTFFDLHIFQHGNYFLYLFYIYLDQFCDTLLFLHHISIPSISHISKDPPVHQSDHTLSHEIYKVFGVRGHDYRCTQAVKLSDQVKQIPYSVLVQTCGKFVQHQHGWAVDDGPGQLHPAALSQ